jgi:alpha-2-macroglobulin
MRHLLVSFLLSILAAVPQSSYERLKTDAAREYAEKSFRRAHELYEQMAKLDLPADERRFVELRLADTAWRADAASPNEDSAAREAAREALTALIGKEPHDRIWADANESLGDYYTQHPWQRNMSAAQPHYLAALDWWAGSSDVAAARPRYLQIVWKLASHGMRYDFPREVLVNAMKIAETPEDRAWARWLLAQRVVMDGSEAGYERAFELLEEILAIGTKTELYDDALQHYATLLVQRNEFNRAIEIYRRIIAEYPSGTTRYAEEVRRAIADILAPAVGVHTAGTFLPDTEQEVVLTWRNTKAVRLALYSVDLTKDARLDENRHWFQAIAIEGRTAVRQWTYETNDAGAHIPGTERVRIEPRLPLGAYVLTASAEGKSARTLVLVTDAHILVHAGNTRMSVYVSDVVTGEPIANARVRVWQRVDRERFVEYDAQTNAQGLAQIEHAKKGGYGGNALVTVAAGARQAHHQFYDYSYARGGDANAYWRIYAFTDRPAYRPGETVQWKMLARIRRDEDWVTPDGESLDYEITDPRGQKVASGVAKLSAYGSFWSELPVTADMPLGVYHVNFKSKDQHRGNAQLFRLEEYKLPEFLVKVATPEGKQYRTGETIEATIDATYYFGGPVANAEVEVVVHQTPFHRYWTPWREYHWYYDARPQSYGGNIIKRETLTTDGNGRAIVRIDTQPDQADMNYRIEARVVDASRREVRGEGNVRVTRQRYSVMARPEHYVHRPGDSVSVEFNALDANDKPVQTTGTVKVFRRRTAGEPVPPRLLRGVIRPPVYDDEEVLTTKVTTDAEGMGTLTFTPKSVGYYVIRWTSTDGTRARDVISAETAVWVTERATTELGYRAGSLDLIVDKETMRAGETANVMVVAPNSGRWVLFSTGGDDMFDTQVLHLDGTVKLVQIPLAEKHIPNFFVTASSVFDVNVATDAEQIVVPPVERFIDVEVKSDRETYEPRQEGTVTITTRDVDGKPVAAEVALAVSDEAVTAIQQDPAGDPRQFFYGDKRGNPLRMSAGLHTQRYVRKEEQLEQDRKAKEEQAAAKMSGYDSLEAGGVAGGVVGGRADGRMLARLEDAAAPPPPPPPSMVAPTVQANAVAEAITVTAMAPEVPPEIDVQVRADFRSTALWLPDVVTDKSGTATVKVKYPEALTTWRATARAASAKAQFGMASSTATTSMPLLVRLQGPRFFVAGDRVTISAVMNNNTGESLTVTPALEVEGLTLETRTHAAVTVPARGEARADWTVAAEKAGSAKLRVTARTSKYGDAMERTFTVYEHGIDKLIARSGKMRGEEALIRLELPRERRATDLTVQVAPTLATTMLDALPYLIEFPYGCTEQTMSRFLPAAIVARTIEKLGLGKARIAGKDLDAVTKAGIARLYDMQHPDGGWGWWKEGTSDAWMTAYVVWGFAIARDAGMRIDEARVNNAANWLDANLVQRESAFEDQAWMLHGLSAWRKTPGAGGRKAFDEVWKNREKLSAYARALFALTAHRWGDAERAKVMIRNLEDGVRIDKTPDQSVLLKGETTAETMQTAYWGARGFWWRWYESPVETTAFALQALVTIDPQNKLVEPVMNWLVKNRRGRQWNNTRDTAIALLAMNDYLQRSGELAGDGEFELLVNGRAVAQGALGTEPKKISVGADLLTDTTQEIVIRRTRGKGPIYFSAEARFVSLEEPVKAAGNEIFVRREYFRLAPRPTLLKGTQYDRLPLRDKESVKSGERVEVVVTIDSKNDYSYLLFEDLKPGGMEAVELQSGQPLYAQSKTKGMVWVYQELRDRKVAMFIDHLPQGLWEIRYTLRAEVPGSFHALPLLGQAMYVPDVRANGDEVRVTVE